MSDGREIINQTYKLIKEISGGLDSKQKKLSKENFQLVKKEVDESLTWAKKCRNKVWLRSKEGTDLAQGCLKAAEKLKENLSEEEKVVDLSYSLKYKLESLAKIIATKASIMT